MSEEAECRFCGRGTPHRCHTEADMTYAPDGYCFTALIMHGGGEVPAFRALSQELMRRAGLVRKEPRDG